MERTERFGTLDDVRLHKERLRALRDGHLAGMRGHWGTLHEGGFHRGVIAGALRDLWEVWSPMGAMRSLMGNGGGMTSAALGLALGKRARSPWGRVLIWAMGAITPIMVNKLRENARSGHILEELGRTWERIKEYVRERREAHRDHDPVDQA